VTGVAIGDSDGDKRYDIGEGLGNITVSAKNVATNAVTTTTTNGAGGYELSLTAGNYTVNFSGSGAATTKQVSLGSKNIKLDLINSGTGSGAPTTPSEPTTPTAPTTPTIPTTPDSSTISGTSGRDILDGTSGSDVIVGLDGSDRLYGGSGNDSINGGSGNDILWGHAGTDTLAGGTGQDGFVFNAPFIGAADKITDYSSIDDTIYLENGIFTSLSSGSLDASAFYAGTAAHDSTDRIIYDAHTGGLYYDANGIGGGSAQLFAQVTAEINLTNADIYVI
jgi:Ca2+-binding RTX toxin-like protein